VRHPTAHIFDFTPDTLRQWATARGLPPFRAAQILEWVYQKGIADPGQMSNLSKRDRELLSDPSDGLTFLSGETISHQSASDGTQKLLVQWEDFGEQQGSNGAGDQGSNGTKNVSLSLSPAHHAPTGDPTRQTECVMIPTEDRKTACISSQVGCPVGCKFCASGIGGLDGNLSAGRIVEQVWRLRNVLGTATLRVASDSETIGSKHATRSVAVPEARISNVVFMGMGEPLSNFAAVTQAIRTLNAEWGMGISARRITISTVGLPKAIEKLAEEFDLPVTLALSLHAPNDDIRRQLIPWAEYTTIPELLAACQKWFDKTGREITLEYILLGGVNDQPEHARQLASVARSLRANVNLIRYNEVKGMPFDRPEDDAVRAFQDILREKGVNTHIRASRGRDIAAACGQLRHEAATAAN
jgi:23S rRNA (adenine2503-C2)-methyltransferase